MYRATASDDAKVNSDKPGEHAVAKSEGDKTETVFLHQFHY